MQFSPHNFCAHKWIMTKKFVITTYQTTEMCHWSYELRPYDGIETLTFLLRYQYYTIHNSKFPDESASRELVLWFSYSTSEHWCTFYNGIYICSPTLKNSPCYLIRSWSNEWVLSEQDETVFLPTSSPVLVPITVTTQCKVTDLCACPPIRRESSSTNGTMAGKGRRRTVCSMMSASLCCRTFYNQHASSEQLPTFLMIQYFL